MEETVRAIEVWESELVVWTERLNQEGFIDAWTGEMIDYDADQISLIKSKIKKCNKKLGYYNGVRIVLEEVLECTHG